MKTEAVGQISKSGGFSQLVRAVEESNVPVGITRSNKVVAIVAPATQRVADAFELCLTFVTKYDKLMQEEGTVEHIDRFRPIVEHLIDEIAIGEAATQMLGIIYGMSGGVADAMTHFEYMQEMGKNVPHRKAVIEKIVARLIKDNPT